MAGNRILKSYLKNHKVYISYGDIFYFRYNHKNYFLGVEKYEYNRVFCYEVQTQIFDYGRKEYPIMFKHKKKQTDIIKSYCFQPFKYEGKVCIIVEIVGEERGYLAELITNRKNFEDFYYIC